MHVYQACVRVISGCKAKTTPRTVDAALLRPREIRKIEKPCVCSEISALPLRSAPGEHGILIGQIGKMVVGMTSYRFAIGVGAAVRAPIPYRSTGIVQP